MDVDKMFKLPALPAAAGQKRRMPDAPAPGASCQCLRQLLAGQANQAELLKRYKPAEVDDDASSASSTAQSNGKGKGRAVTVADEEDEDMDYAGREYKSHTLSCPSAEV